ncbi:MAG TPA: sigma 54-interacting transcriptional regulator [Pyrinomonadaceae bacterium]|nr:sigma 54-interacting transcriptional regulator [Pyrinomonadaceae bacterium]
MPPTDTKATAARPPSDGEAARAGSDLSATRAGRRAEAARLALEVELEEARGLLDQGLSGEVVKRANSVARAARADASLLAKARCLLAAALEMQGRYRESLEAVQAYEAAGERERLDWDARLAVAVQLGLAYNYAGDHPRAVAMLNGALRQASERPDGARAGVQAGAVYLALARVYRSINEYTIARDHAERALEHYRGTGDWRGLAEAYFAVGLAELFEGDYETALRHLEQALKLVGDRPASYLLGKLYTNMAGACVFLRRPHEGIAHLERAISYYERTEHKVNAVDGYNNLGVHLTLVGDWARAEEALSRALALAAETDAKARVPMILDSLGELLLLRGELEEAQERLTRAVSLAGEQANKWYSAQALRTLGRCHLAMGDEGRALEEGRATLEMAERIGDRQAVCDSRLLVAEAHLSRGERDECARQLSLVAAETADSPAYLAAAGEAQRLHGLLALGDGDPVRASQHFGRSLSIYEMLGDRYRTALARYELGRASVAGQPARAAECLTEAAETFRQLGARQAAERAEAALSSLEREGGARRREESASLLRLLLLRLTEAVVSRELLLRELAAVVAQETGARNVLVSEEGKGGRWGVTACHGWTRAESEEIAAALGEAESEGAREELAAARGVSVVRLRGARARTAALVYAPRGPLELLGGLPFDTALRVVELGLDVCAPGEREGHGADGHEQAAAARESSMPGFIHSSPAMSQLIDEVHKIRSSDVTVLVTGESGTGKELVARAIHALSSRRSKVFVPFNCTAVPKELSDAYLFGYRRGSFTGAVSDSPGVIRTAAGGTLFLDEVGDLPLDIQPKLLRFLQEGEIQPLGEQRPAKVDVRIIAATNSDLEAMVADGRFREDLYYRLNVIRLRVPPLRERRPEIPLIVGHYVKQFSEKFGRTNVRLSAEVMDLLMVYDWPGNVRQLLNEVQRVVARAEDGAVITADQLSPELKRTASPLTGGGTGSLAHPAFAPVEDQTLPEAVEDLERRMIAEALRKHSGNVSRAARELGITRRGLQLKLSRYRMRASA